MIIVNFKNWKLYEAEKIIIIKCLETYPDKSLPKIAKLLGISERTLHRKLYQYDLRKFRNGIKQKATMGI